MVILLGNKIAVEAYLRDSLTIPHPESSLLLLTYYTSIHFKFWIFRSFYEKFRDAKIHRMRVASKSIQNII